MQFLAKSYIANIQPIAKFYMLKNIVLLQDISKVSTFASFLSVYSRHNTEESVENILRFQRIFRKY
jgi:hypothetical protein